MSLSSPQVLCLIVARGGSKRFPGKNIFPLQGKPLVSFPIEAAKAATRVNRVIISTDDEAIADIAKEYGVEVPFMRPVELAQDASLAIDVAVHAVTTLEEQEGYKPDYILLLQPTTPLVTAEQIDSAIVLAVEKQADSVVTVADVDTTSHPFNIREVRADGTIGFWMETEHYEYVGKKRPAFYRAANLWLSSYQTLMEHKRFEGKKNYPIVVDALSASDIDFQEDLERIDVYLSLQGRKK